MSAYAFQRRDLERASDAWRPLDRALLRWVLAHGGSELLATTAAWASFADGNGDIALPMGDAPARRGGMPAWTPAHIAALCAEPMVSADDSGAMTPFVLDQPGNFYLWRNRCDESAVVEHVRRRRADCRRVVVGDADLDALFHGRDDAVIAPQRAAVRHVAGRSLFVLTGGPGTGKTTTVLRMLLILQRLAEKKLTIRVAAPTGKAAQRLNHALREVKRDLLHNPALPLSADWHALLDRVPDHEALTLHRLLGYQPWNNRYKRSASDPIAADVVVVDEASMIDLAMLRSLLEAMRPEAALLLVGDADQLTSIAAGSVLMDIVSVLESDQAGDIVRLQHSFRAERSLASINEAVRSGDAGAFTHAWRSAGARASRRVVANARQLAQSIRTWVDDLARLDLRPRIDSVDAQSATVHAALQTLAARQLLCALREGEFGSLAVNAAIERQLKLEWGIAETMHWYSGRSIIVTRNDYAAHLFNGDIGVCLADANGEMRVWFESRDEAGHSAARSFLPSALPPHEGAFAITIHKSQGSEYDRVAVLLPPDTDNRILSRQLLYTALSRARHNVELWSTDGALEAALAHPVRRASGLSARLRGGSCGARQQMSET
jgi:exodeoxyribonuclease V alpha subunit